DDIISVYNKYIHQFSPSGFHFRNISYMSKLAATDAFKEGIFPCIGNCMSQSHFSLTNLVIPLPSLPITNAIAVCPSNVRESFSPVSSVRTTHICFAFKYAIARRILDTLATGICSIAPAEAVDTDGVTRAERRCGIT